MAYSKRDDGLFDVTLDNGLTVPMGLKEEELRAAGHMPADTATAFPRPGAGYQAGVDFGGFKEGLSPLALAEGPIKPSDTATDATQVDPREAAQMAQARTLEGQHGHFGEATKRSIPHEVPRQAPPKEMDTGTPKEERSEAPPPPKKENPADLVPLGGPQAPQQSRVRRIPGRDMRASWQVQPGAKVPDEIKEDINADDRAEVVEGRAANVAALREDVRNQREANLMEQRNQLDLERGRRAKIDEGIKAKEDLISRRDKEAEDLTPQTIKRVWEDKGILGRLMAAIAIGVGGYQQGLTGRQNNVGLDLVNQAIRDEVDSQREAYETAVAKGKEARNDYAKALELYGTPEAAEQDLTMRRLGVAEKMIDNYGQQIGTEEGLSAARQMAGQYRMDRADAKMRLFEAERNKVVENWVRTPDQFTGGGAPAVKKEHLARAVRLPNGQYAFARSPEGAKSAQQKVMVDAAIAQEAERLRYLRGLPGAKTDPALRGQIQTAGANLFLMLKEGATLGTLDKGTLEFRDEWTGDPSALIDMGGVDAKLGEVGKAAAGRLNRVVQYELQADPESLTPYGTAAPPSRPNE